MASDDARLVLAIEREVLEELLRLAHSRDVTLEQYCHDLLARRVAIEKRGYLSAEEAPLLAELWDNESDAVYDELT